MQNPNNKTFTISHEDVNTGTVLEGTFTTKRLSIMDRSKIGARKSQLSGGLFCVRNDEGDATGVGIDEETDYLNTMLAHLEVSLVQVPMWFKLHEVYDTSLLVKLYTEVMGHEASFFRSKNGEANNGAGGVGQTDGGPQRPGEVSGNAPKKVVGQEVSASLDA